MPNNAADLAFGPLCSSEMLKCLGKRIAAVFALYSGKARFP